MFSIVVNTTKGTNVGEFQCVGHECSIGKDTDHLIVLRGLKVARTHAIAYQTADGLFIKDSGSRTGIKLNGNRCQQAGPLSANDEVQVGDYLLRLQEKDSRATLGEAPVAIPTPTAASSAINDSTLANAAHPVSAVSVADEQVDTSNAHTAQQLAEINFRNMWRRRVHKELLTQMDLRRVNVNEMSDEELRERSGTLIRQIVQQIKLPTSIEPEALIEEVLDETIGLGPLEGLLADPAVSEIMVNSHDQIFYEKAGQLYLSDISFSDDQAVLGAIERIVTPIGRRIDEGSPMVDARLKDGSRVNAIIPPLALKGPCITIRKFMQQRLECSDLVKFGSMSQPMTLFLETAVKQKRNVIISGGTGSGKTTLLNVLSNFIPKNERIITVEDAAELQLNQPNLVSLEAKPANQEGKGAVAIRDLVKNCLRMRPDRVVVGECRGSEALDMLQAMNTGHDGSLTTAHSNSPRDCISRLEVMVMMAGMDLPAKAIREQIASAINIIVQQSRFADGSRRITSICEVTGLEGNTVQLSEIFKFQQTGFNEHGKVQGFFTATGAIPEFYERLRRDGIQVDLSIFQREV